uniref:N-alpha-acetyltransferase 60 n=1 Tax=Trypanosoma congolense (strain IL3000) TaxID=1068625 RepID=G0UY46_TRYCI|nr:putative acetyltransferase [Trypanosoma congolense IL3000]
MDQVEFAKLTSRDDVSLTLELHWGISADDIRDLRALHELSFPLTYDDTYYQWLLSDSCVALTARISYCDFMRRVHTTEWEEHMEPPGQKESSGPNPAEYTVIGFCIGQMAYARYDDGSLAAGPTGYLGSFAVHPKFRRRGIGETLLRRYLSYMLFEIPVPRSLHLGERWGSYGHILQLVFKSVLAPVSWCSLWAERQGETQLCHMEDKVSNSSGSGSREKCCLKPRCGLPEVWLHCLSSDGALLHFYGARGFIRARELRGFYTINDQSCDAALLVLRSDDFVKLASTPSPCGSSCQETPHSTATKGVEVCPECETRATLSGALAEVADIHLSGSAVNLDWHRYDGSLEAVEGPYGVAVGVVMFAFKLGLVVWSVWIMVAYIA